MLFGTRNRALIKFFLGILLGIAASTTTFFLCDAYRGTVSYTLLPNIVIAVATVVAVGIHMHSVARQKDAREWDVKKDILLKLTSSLAELISETQRLRDAEYNHEPSQGGEVAHNTTDFDVFKQFSKYILETVYVYKPVLPENLILAIENYQSRDKEIENYVDRGDYDHGDAYYELLKEQHKLHLVLSNCIKEASGI